MQEIVSAYVQDLRHLITQTSHTMQSTETKWCHCVLFIALFLPVTHACGRGSITIENNGYKNVLIAVADTVPDSPALLDRIRSVFTDASQVLYRVTRQRAYFSEITILVPQSWQQDANSYTAATSETLDKSDIVVDEPDERFDQGHSPFVIKTTPCGESGYYMHLTPQYLTDDEIGLEFGSYGRVIVHEWSHLRYGVFDEYPRETDGPHFYATSGGEIEAVRCSLRIRGRMENIETGGRCRYEDNLPETDCRFRDISDPDQEGYGSLMYRSYLDQIDEFCDDDIEDTKTLHNSEAPNPQNTLCDRKSVWQVLREHPDFNGTNDARSISDTTPTFLVVQRKVLKTVLVLDRSGSMGPQFRNDIVLQAQGCSNFITNIIQDNEELGIVSFNDFATRDAELTVINGTTRTALQSAIPTTPGGGTSIGAGIAEALLMLEETPGGTIIVVTDGEENTSPLIADVTQRVADAGVTIHSIAVTDSADTGLDTLAAQTGGLSFIFSSRTTNAMNEAFKAIGELNTNPTERSYTVQSMSYELSASQNQSGSALIDNSLGRGTLFTFDYTGSDVEASVTSPSGIVYTATNQIVTHDTVFGIYKFSIPDDQFEAGEWHYSVTSLDVSAMRVAVSVTSQSATQGVYPIIAHVNWGSREINSIAPDQDNARQALYATVSQGYAPVLNAEVVATVETPGGQMLEVALLDKGSGPDVAVNDGIYSAYFIGFDGSGRYGVQLRVNSNDVTVISPTKILGRGVATNVFESGSSQAEDISVTGLQRAQIGSSFQLANFSAENGTKLYNPGRITDLRMTSASYENRSVTLQWTAVGDQLDTGRASLYELRYGTNFTAMITSFETQILVTSDDIISGLSDLGSPQEAGQAEEIVVQVPGRGSLTYVFGLVARDTDGRDVAGPLSNIASVSMQDFSDEDPSDDASADSLSSFQIAMIAGGVGVALFCVLTVVVLVAWEPCSTAKRTSRPYSKYMVSTLPSGMPPKLLRLPRHGDRLYGHYPRNNYHHI